MKSSFISKAKALCLVAVSSFVLPANAQSYWPTPETEDQWGIAIVDVETTGLDPAHAEMIDMSAVYIDLEGNELGRFFSPIMPPHADRVEPGAAAVNGYSKERWEALGAPSEAKVTADYIDFHKRTAGKRRFIFMSYNTPFDKGFVDAWLKRNGSSFDSLFVYMPLDLPSVAWGLGYQVMGTYDMADALGLPRETSDPLKHTGETGTDWNLMIYRHLLDLRKNLGAERRSKP